MKRFAGPILSFVLVFSAQAAFAVEPLKVAFVNPGHPKSFWLHVEAVMRDAAEDLGIELAVQNAAGDHDNMISMTTRLVSQSNRPDAIILVNEYQAGGPMLEAAADADIPVFMILSLFTGRDADYFGEPRESFPSWIGSLRPDHAKAGYDIAQVLIEEGHRLFGEELKLIAIGGNITTQAAEQRERGLKQAIEEDGKTALIALHNADWRRDFSRRYVRRLLRSDPDVRLIWAANDDMALGALDAIEEAGLIPGKDILVGGLNWSNDALAQVRAGRMAVDVGGHFMGGGLALVMIHDYLNGRDFVDEGVSRVFDMGVFRKETLPPTDQLDFKAIDFRALSRLYNPELSHYPLDIGYLLQQIGISE